jgi:hypothetical protein
MSFYIYNFPIITGTIGTIGTPKLK